jgi:hypothetical protein
VGGKRNSDGMPHGGDIPTRYARNMKSNKDTNVDKLSREQLTKEARLSKNRARVSLLNEIHFQLDEAMSMETEYGYDPKIDMSFTGEFEAIGS